MKTTVFTLIVAAFLVSSTASGQTVQTKSLFSTGGQLMTSGTTTVNANLGDVFTGVTYGGTTEVQQGFWTSPTNQIIGVNGPKITLVYYLGQAKPNPATSSTDIEFGIPVETSGALTIFDSQGRVIRRLFRGPVHTGVYRTTWDLRTDSGQHAPVGIYLYRLQLATFTANGKLAVLK